MRLAAYKGANGSKSAPNAEEQATNTMKIEKSAGQRIAEATLGGPCFRLEICMSTQTVVWALVSDKTKTIEL